MKQKEGCRPDDVERARQKHDVASIAEFEIRVMQFQKVTHPRSLRPELLRFHGARDEITITMADEDEDVSHLRAPDAVDIDLTEETQDFRFLDKLTFVTDAAWSYL
jgi:hypothetical protein